MNLAAVLSPNHTLAGTNYRISRASLYAMKHLVIAFVFLVAA